MSEQSGVKAVAEKKGEAVLTIKVYRKDGTVEEHAGLPVEIPISEALAAAINEYKQVTARALELECVITQLLNQQEKGA